MKQNSRLVISQPHNFAPASPSISWTSGSSPYLIIFVGGSSVKLILSTRLRPGSVFGCGFLCNGDCHDHLFAVFILYSSSDFGIYDIERSHVPQVVWSANRNSPVKMNATLELTTSGLVLKDSGGTATWSTDIGGKSVAGLNLTDMGNLVLLDKNGGILWQSFDHPTDCLLYGQKLVAGQKLTANASSSNLTEGVLYSLSVTNEGLFASIGSYPPYDYYRFYYHRHNPYIAYDATKASGNPCYVKLVEGALVFYVPVSNNTSEDKEVAIISNDLTVQYRRYMRLESDGHVRLYDYDGLAPEDDVLNITKCEYPMGCGKYGVCINSLCSCPNNRSETNYFQPINYSFPDLGCAEFTPLSCQVSQYQSFLELQDTSSTTVDWSSTTDLEIIDPESCKQLCLKNCSCRAAIFRSYDGKCFLQTQIYSFVNKEAARSDYHPFTTYIKVQSTPKENTVLVNSSVKKKKNKTPSLVLGFSLGSLMFGLSLIAMLVALFLRKQDDDDENEKYLDQVPGMPKRFSYEDLKSMTQNFNRKLGEGGFGTVFEGIQTDGTKIAVKRLDGFGQIKKSFVAEVATIGSIHHVNLVKMVGFCVGKSHRLLVYEFMSNGSLDKWIFHKTYELLLSWQQRKKIILDIAKGLSYLHEECSQKIIHLDIKPENILLDDEFNGKVSDFGLSKLVDRDQSQVMTTMRGTPGYLAPEWLSSLITEKVDVYSFGIVMMEILCGRRNIDRSQPEEAMHLLALFKKKYEENQVLGLIDKCCEDVRANEEEVLSMMKVVAWCLQTDFAKRPSMSMVVKVLEGVTNVEYEMGLDYSFSGAKLCEEYQNHGGATLLLPSVLSQAR
ncbi:G-type lectin S-receptor-like serine/threonine-protein kinase SD2-5 [Ziziphus jujuba]|uniref:Receptor-like serine/threonine-protein kinase n=1 Tax=Ziziphus jujuba TaxID=326968 RepID=A0A6P3ZPK9_ZIZJJ|nr:G-type lectin S-receptor-like serine/threonine-protein kinase SD2-5 [Ziziphus jujuba]